MKSARLGFPSPPHLWEYVSGNHHIYLHLHLQLYLFLYMYLCIYVSMYLCIYVSMYPCIYVSMYLSIYVYIYIYMCMYTTISCVKTCTHLYSHKYNPLSSISIRKVPWLWHQKMQNHSLLILMTFASDN